MRAAWDWALPRETPAEERAVVEFAADLGFDTLIVDDPTPAMVERGSELGVDVLAIVSPEPPDGFAAEHPDGIQRMLPAEEEAAALLDGATPDGYQTLTHRPFFQFRAADWLCFDHPAAREALADRVAAALDVAGGVALDGFGYRNQYACFCPRCRERRAAAGGELDPETVATDGAEQLVDVHDYLYQRANAVDGAATVTNHVWPPFRPDPRVGDRYPLDFCSQTIAWFYRPHRSLERVAFEARRLRERATGANTPVPFVGVFADPYRRRSADRVRRELEIALDHGDGNVVFCTLGAPDADPAVADAVRAALG